MRFTLTEAAQFLLEEAALPSGYGAHKLTAPLDVYWKGLGGPESIKVGDTIGPCRCGPVKLGEEESGTGEGLEMEDVGYIQVTKLTGQW